MIANQTFVDNFEANMGIKIPAYKRWEAQLGVTVFLGYYRRPGWSGALPFYLWECPKHGLVVDYPHGHKQALSCPKCREETQ